MNNWSPKQYGDLILYQSKTLSWLPGIVQCFSTRHGGVSAEPYDSLNMSLKCGDNADDVAQNRIRLAEALKIPAGSMIYAEQVHGNKVGIVDHESDRMIAGVDALVTGDRGVFLTLLFADCYPSYIVDPRKKVIALAHAGWRGLDSGIIPATTNVMLKDFGVTPRDCLVAVGPGIAAENYEVDSDVADKFREAISAGSAVAVMPKHEFIGKWDLNLRSVIFSQLLSAGFKPESIETADLDTFSNKSTFFSHRRESLNNQSTGRMAAVLGMRA